jgi:hypothetical protein
VCWRYVYKSTHCSAKWKFCPVIMIDEVHEHILVAFVWLVDTEHTINTNVSESSKANYGNMYYEYSLVNINRRMLKCLYYRAISVASPVLTQYDVADMFENINRHIFFSSSCFSGI